MDLSHTEMGGSGGETGMRGKARSSFIIPNLQMRKLESKETDSLAQGHTASMGLRSDLKHICPTPELYLTHRLLFQTKKQLRQRLHKMGFSELVRNANACVLPKKAFALPHSVHKEFCVIKRAFGCPSHHPQEV